MRINLHPHLHFLVTEGGAMRVDAFLTEHAVVNRTIDHLKLTFVAERPPPACAFQDLLMANVIYLPV